MADGDALHITRTKASSAVGVVRRHSKRGSLLFNDLQFVIIKKQLNQFSGAL